MLIALPQPLSVQSIETGAKEIEVTEKAPHVNAEIHATEKEVKEKNEKRYQSVREEVEANFLKIMKKVLNDMYDRAAGQQYLTSDEIKQIKMLLSTYNNLFGPRTTSRAPRPDHTPPCRNNKKIEKPQYTQ
jgi:hypothetical protein